MNRGERRRRARAPRAAPRTDDRWLLPLIVASCTAIAFAPALRNGFVDWDDLDTLTENPFYRGLGWPQLKWMWTTTLMGQYIPVTWMTLGLDYVVWGMDPVGYHLTSLVLHVANAGLFYLVALRLLALGIADGASANDFSIRLGAAFAALVFGVHPLRVESVAWATERRDVLCGFFWLLATLAYLRYARWHTDEPADRRTWYGISFGCFCLAVLSQGQRKRLALLTAFLEDRPIYIFDEWAADQDRHYREIFYTRLLADLRARGKTVVVISHDDRYYHLGDRVVRLEYGKMVEDRRVSSGDR